MRRFLLDDQMVDRGWVVSEVTTSQALFETHGVGLWALRKKEHEDPEHGRIAADADAGDDPSIRLMERLGMQFEGRVEKGRLDTLGYALKSEGVGRTSDAE